MNDMPLNKKWLTEGSVITTELHKGSIDVEKTRIEFITEDSLIIHSRLLCEENDILNIKLRVRSFCLIFSSRVIKNNNGVVSIELPKSCYKMSRLLFKPYPVKTPVISNGEVIGQTKDLSMGGAKIRTTTKVKPVMGFFPITILGVDLHAKMNLINGDDLSVQFCIEGVSNAKFVKALSKCKRK